MVAIGGDPLDVVEEKVAEPFHLRQPLPPQRVDPAEQESQHAGAGFVRPEAIELLPQDIRLEQATIRREQRLQLLALRPADRLPTPQQQPAFPPSVLAHHRPGPEELLAADLVERGARVLQHVELVEDQLGVQQRLRHRIEMRAMHVSADRGDSRSLPGHWPLIAGAVLLLGVAIAPRVVHAQGPEWHATVGVQSKDLGRQALAFLPNEIWIHAGDSITWRFDVDEIHTVTFLKSLQPRTPFPFGCSFGPTPVFSTSPATFNGSACMSTPPLVKPQTFTVNFPTAGNYKLVCLVHQDMTGVVHVLDPTDTITFGTEPANPMPPVNVTVDADGARHSVINSPADSAHSGFILAAPQDRVGLAQSPISVTRFRVTFPHAGVFPYICALHDDLGMKGKVVVLP